MGEYAIIFAVVAAVVSAAAAYFIAKSRFSHPSEDAAKLRVAEEMLSRVDEAKHRAEASIEQARADLQGSRADADDLRRQVEDLRRRVEDARRDAEANRKAAVVEAKEAALRAAEEAKEEARKSVAESEKAVAAQADRVAKREHLVLQKEELIARKELDLTRRELGVREQEKSVEGLRADATRVVTEQRAKLEAIAGMTGDEARRSLIEQFYDDARRSAAREAKIIEDSAREEADRRAKRIIGLAVQRYAGEHVQERAVTTVHLPNDELKGRIIGREGRNIRALQEACGVDFIVDDTPETIVVSGFDPLRREIARIALEKLIADGRIHPTRIEEVVVKARAEVDQAVNEAAEHALLELGITRLHPELARLVGRLKYRYSYAQNVLKHSIECGFLAGLMAAELGQNEKLARRAGLLHDIGKAVSHEQEGGHAVIGGQFARKYGEDPIVANAIACHHDDEPATSVIGHLVTAADALSGARPGARREVLESYVKRLQDLETISGRFAGVERSYAIQAGREIRVLVEPSEVNDAEAALLAREIAKRIEDELTYPGQIRVTVIRETRAVDYAK